MLLGNTNSMVPPGGTEFSTYLNVMFTHGVQVRGHRVEWMRP